MPQHSVSHRAAFSVEKLAAFVASKPRATYCVALGLIALGGALVRWSQAAENASTLLVYLGGITPSFLAGGDAVLEILSGDFSHIDRVFDGVYPPGYSILVGLSASMLPPFGELPPVLWGQVVVQACAVGVVGAAMGARYGGVTGLACAVGMAFWPPFVLQGIAIVPEALLICTWCLLLVLQDWAFARPSVRRWLLLGVGLGLCTLVRAELLLLPVCVAVRAGVECRPWRALLSGLGVCAAAFLVVVGGTSVLTRAVQGERVSGLRNGTNAFWEGFGEVHNAAGILPHDREAGQWLRRYNTGYFEAAGQERQRADYWQAVRTSPRTALLGVLNRTLKVVIEPYWDGNLDKGQRYRRAATAGRLWLFAAGTVAWLFFPLPRSLRWACLMPLAYTMFVLGITHHEPRYALPGALAPLFALAGALSLVAPYVGRAAGRLGSYLLAGYRAASQVPAAAVLGPTARHVLPLSLPVIGLFAVYAVAVRTRTGLIETAAAHVHTMALPPVVRDPVWVRLAESDDTTAALPVSWKFSQLSLAVVQSPSFTLEPETAYALLLRFHVLRGAARVRIRGVYAGGAARSEVPRRLKEREFLDQRADHVTIHEFFLQRPGRWTLYVPLVVRGIDTFLMELQPLFPTRGEQAWRRRLLYALGDRGGELSAAGRNATTHQHYRLWDAVVVRLEDSVYDAVAVKESPEDIPRVWAELAAWRAARATPRDTASAVDTRVNMGDTIGRNQGRLRANLPPVEPNAVLRAQAGEAAAPLTDTRLYTRAILPRRGEKTE